MRKSSNQKRLRQAKTLPADAEPIDELLIPVVVRRLDVVEQTAPLADHFQQPATRMIVFTVGLEMLGKIGDPLGQDGDLDFWGPSVIGFGRIFLDELLLALSANRHRIILAVRGFSGPGRDVVQRGQLKMCAIGPPKQPPAQPVQYRDYRALDQRNFGPSGGAWRRGLAWQIEDAPRPEFPLTDLASGD